ncbi:MAG: SCO family protein [Phycisphaerales bacterium]
MVLAMMAFHIAGVARAQSYLPADVLPEQFKGVGIDEHLDQLLPLDATFTNSEGQQVKLGDYFRGDKPVLLALVYYRCPMLCTLVVNGMMDAARQIDWTPGEGPDNQYQMLVISFDAAETPELAARKKRVYVDAFGRAGAAGGMHFLVGSKESVDRLTRAVGFNYRWDAKTGQFVHASAIYAVTPAGHMSKYLFGVQYDPTTVRLALVEAAGGKIGTISDKIWLMCSHYNPKEGTYAASVVKIMNLSAPGAAAAILVILGLVMHNKRRKKLQNTHET